MIDPDLLLAWLTARSIARGLPAPVPDRGGWRVDTGAPEEQCRYVFASVSPGLTALGVAIDSPFVMLKACVDDAVLAAALPARWSLAAASHVMIGANCAPVACPAGYRIERRGDDGPIAVRIMADDGQLAASGYAAAALGVFAYDRIVTAPDHRRRGLGRVVMSLLGARAPLAATHMLVATDMGRSLYETLGWRVVAPYASAFIPVDQAIPRSAGPNASGSSSDRR